MTYGVTGASTAASAAARRRQLLQEQEEEEMIQYTEDDISGDWEFKIVRSNMPAFRKPEVLNKLLEEESQAGWVMLEKLDDSRVRFKRPHSAQAKDAYLPEGVDPYRTHYGPLANRQAMTMLLMGVLLLSTLAGVLVFIYAVR